VDARLPAALAATARFELHEYLGSGSFGVVWSVHDRERDARVALKWLRDGDAAMIARFKREFRALSGLGHPNLVEFRDLLAVDDAWFFTMELVDGVDLLTWTRPGGVLHLGRLRSAFEQLAAGLSALHGAAMLHRDIKPSNVLVTREGRVVLLDFGLVTEIGEDGVAQTVGGRVVGTPGYMSPEQAAGKQVTPASDWYAVGAILYQVLAGALPFDGLSHEVLARKQSEDPPPPNDGAPAGGPLLPEALPALCMDLLARNPSRRPVGAAFLERLRAAVTPEDDAPAPASGIPAAAVATAGFVGRDPHLAALGDALSAVRSGKTVVALVPGRSGMGKSALVRAFVDRVRRDDPGAVVLEGRCYEREDVPYKALDSLADALCRHLQRLPTVARAEILPRDFPLLAKLFPVFLQVEGATAKKVRGVADVVQERQRAFRALRELLQRMGDRSPLVLCIDDLQWGDVDSEPLLLSALRGPDAPVLLFVAAYRSEDGEAPLVRALMAIAEGDGVERREVPVGELSPEAARELARLLVGARGEEAAGEAFAADLARESSGSPLFLRQLAALGRDGGKIGLSEAVLKRVEALAPGARRLLEVMAVSGRPLSLAVAAVAAGVAHDRDAVVSALRRESLVRSRPSEAKDEIEVYHDRIREVVTASLPPQDLRARHKALADALANSGDHDAEARAVHLLGAGERELASSFAQKAAERAERSLAFDRAARMWALALDLEDDDGPTKQTAKLRLAEALACAGRGREAADHFLAVAERAVGSDALELRRRAAEQLLFTGHLDLGLRVIEDILAVMGMRARQSRLRTVLSLVFRRVVLRLRGLRFTERRADQVSRDDLVRIDACFSLARGLGIVDPVRGAEFQTRSLLLALAAGDAVRIAQAIALEGAYRAAEGVGAKAVVERLVARSTDLAQRTGDAQARGLTALMRGIGQSLLGEMRQAVASCDAAYAELREKCVNVTWELDNAAFFACFSLFVLGDLRELERRVPVLVAEARARGDLYGEVIVRAQVGWLLHLAKDDLPRAHADLDIIEERWSRERFLVQHAWKTINEVELALYQEDAAEALRVAEDAVPKFRASLLMRVSTMRVRLGNAHGRALLASAKAASGQAREHLLRQAEAKGKAVLREKLPLARGYALLVLAGVAHLRGDAAASAATELALAEFDARGMVLYASAARLLLSEVKAARGAREPAETLRTEALRVLEEQGVRRPLAVARMYAPSLMGLAGVASA
jgi:hypothetical protein